MITQTPTVKYVFVFRLLFCFDLVSETAFQRCKPSLLHMKLIYIIKRVKVSRTVLCKQEDSVSSEVAYDVK